MEMAPYRQAYKDRAVAQLLSPDSVAMEVVAREIGVGAGFVFESVISGKRVQR